MTQTTEDKGQSLMAKLLEEQGELPIPEVGSIIEGTVIDASKNEVHLDIEGVSTGVIRGPELIDESGEYSELKIGDKAQATVLELENENGVLELSLRQAGHQKASAKRRCRLPLAEQQGAGGRSSPNASRFFRRMGPPGNRNAKI